MKLLDTELIRGYLTIASLYITGYEILQGSVINHLKGFFSVEARFDEDGSLVFTDGPEYLKIKNTKYPELNNRTSEYYSCCNWYLQNEVIDLAEFELLQKIRKHRNRIAHNLPELLVDDNYTLDIPLFEAIQVLLTKIEKFWILEFEIPVNPDFDGQNIKEEDVSSGVISLMDYLIGLVQKEKEKIKDHKINR